jgi:membrane-bound lytic murein transglycosylase D
VRKGETLSLIASRYNSSVTKIVRANNIRKKHLIRVGQKLKIPLGTGKSTPVIVASEIPSDGLYRVRKGDSLWLIARKFNTNTKTLQRINNLRTTRLKIGQVLKVTETPPEPLPEGKYRVRKGDSLWLIAKKYNTDTKTLQQINNLQSTRLQVGQVLKVTK